MSHPRIADLEALLRALVDGGVEFIVVGGAAAVIHGAPITTQDLDIVHRRTEDNVERLLRVLEALDARVRSDFGGPPLRPAREHLMGRGQLNLSTSLGPLDPLCEIGSAEGFEELDSASIEVADGGLRLRVLGLDKLIEVKTVAARAKDKLVLPVLLALRDEQG